MKLKIQPGTIDRDINPAEMGPEAWNNGNNVVFQNGFAGAAPGWDSAVGACLARPLWLLPVQTVNVIYWIYVGNNTAGTAGLISVTDGTTHWDITPAGGWSAMLPGDITGGVLNGIPFLNNGLEVPVFWDLQTANPCTTLPDWPAAQRAKCLRAFKYHLMAGNISDGGGDFPDLLVWSSAANPGAIPDSWTPLNSNEAGNFTISTGAGGIVDLGQLRELMIIYKQHSTSIAQYIAGQFVFSNRKAFVTSGILARNCYQEYYGAHYVITDGSFIKHNGQEVEDLIDGRNRDFLFDQIDAETYPGAHLAASHSTKSLWLNIPAQGSDFCNAALVYDLVSGGWGVSELPDVSFMTRGILNQAGIGYTWDSAAGTWDEQQRRWNEKQFNPTTDLLVMAEPEGEVLLAHGGFTRLGQNVPVYLSLESKDMGDPQRRKLVAAIWTHLEAQAPAAGDISTYAVRIGTQDRTGDPISWSAKVFPGGDIKADFLQSGRYISLEISGDQKNDWRLNSLDMDYSLQGLW